MGAIQSSGWAIFVWPYLVLAQLLGEKRLQVVIYYVRIVHVYQTFLSFWVGPFPCRRCTEFSKTIGLTMRSVQVFLSIGILPCILLSLSWACIGRRCTFAACHLHGRAHGRPHHRHPVCRRLRLSATCLCGHVAHAVVLCTASFTRCPPAPL